MQIRIDESLCIGSAQCAFAAPTVFALDADGYAKVIDPVASQVREAVEEAVASCPMAAISIDEESVAKP